MIKAKFKFVFVLALSLMSSFLMSALVFAADEFDMVSTITTSVGDLKTQIFAVIAVVVPVVIAIVGAKIGISKGIGMFKSLTGK